MKTSFKITSVSREDFEIRGYDASKLTDEDMERIASKMADVYIENFFWDSIDYHAVDRNLPKLKEEMLCCTDCAGMTDEDKKKCEHKSYGN